MKLASAMTGIMLPRKLMTPSTPGGKFGARVIGGVHVTSRTLNTLMPKVSVLPSENSRISMRFEPAMRVRSSTVCSSLEDSAEIFMGARGLSGKKTRERLRELARLEFRHVFVDPDGHAELAIGG